MHGGPAAMRLPEHQHVETQVEVHFPGEMEILAPGRRHIGEWEAGSEVIVVLIPPIAFERAADEILVRQQFRIEDRLFDGEAFLQSIASTLRNQFHSPVGVSRLFLESSGYLLAEHILRNYAGTVPLVSIRDRLDAALLAELARFVDENLEHGLSVRGMARAMRMGVHGFSRALRLATGGTPYRFVQARRLQLAKAMLARREMSLAEIAIRLGFASQSHFTAVFRRATGVTPQVYRYGLRDARIVTR
jgi:AraC family transcriptional regulator